MDHGIDTLVDGYRDKVFNPALRILNNHHDAEDATQDTFIQIYRNIDGFKGERKLMISSQPIIT